MKVTKEYIVSYIPQRAPFVMIDNLIEATNERFVTDFIISPDNIFLEDGSLSAYALIENIAQSGAAGLATINAHDMQKPVSGFIGGISKLKVYDLPKVNNTIHTIVRPIAQLGGMFLLKAETLVDDKKMLECEVKLVGSNSKLIE